MSLGTCPWAFSRSWREKWQGSIFPVFWYSWKIRSNASACAAGARASVSASAARPQRIGREPAIEGRRVAAGAPAERGEVQEAGGQSARGGGAPDGEEKTQLALEGNGRPFAATAGLQCAQPVGAATQRSRLAARRLELAVEVGHPAAQAAQLAVTFAAARAQLGQLALELGDALPVGGALRRCLRAQLGDLVLEPLARLTRLGQRPVAGRGVLADGAQLLVEVADAGAALLRSLMEVVAGLGRGGLLRDGVLADLGELGHQRLHPRA